MDTKRFVGIFVALFVIGSIPIFIAQPSGLAYAGLSSGFVTPLHNIYHPIVIIITGLAGVMLGRNIAALLPVAFILMLLIGVSLDESFRYVPLLRLLQLGAVLAFAIVVAMAGTGKAFIVVLCSVSSLAFHFGMHYAAMIPEIAPPPYYLLGMLVCVVLLLSLGVVAGLSVSDEIKRLAQKLRNKPPVSSFISLFF